MRQIRQLLQRFFGSWYRFLTTRKTNAATLAAWIGSFVLVCCVGSVVLGAVRSTGQAVGLVATNTPTLVPTAEPTRTPIPTATFVPTEGPTNTPQPTNTPEPPTAIPTATPIPATPTPIPPVVLKGKGQTVTDKFTLPALVSRVTFKHTGRSNFAVTSYRDGARADLLVNTIGNYSGIRPLFGSGEWYLEIDADGPWSATIEAITDQPDAAQGIEGGGDFVSGLFQPTQSGAVPYAFTHNGKSNFAVYLHCAGGDDLIQNEIGHVDGSAVVTFVEGPCAWEVQADGDWSIKPK